MIRYFCNRCQKELEKTQIIGRVSISFTDGIYGICKFHTDTMLSDEPGELIFCEDCTHVIKQFAYPNEEASAEELCEVTEDICEVEENICEVEEDCKVENKQGKEPKRRPGSIDIFKAMALHNAGFPNSEIAAEMHYTESSIANALTRYRKQYGDMKPDEARRLKEGNAEEEEA